jgi:hypothetical protein
MLYIGVEGSFKYPNIQLFFDTDGLGSTGYAAGWPSYGAEYLLENGKLYKYAGKSKDWTWTYVGDAAASAVGKIAEYKLPWNMLPSRKFAVGVRMADSMWAKSELLPTMGKAAPNFVGTCACANCAVCSA